MAQEIEIHIAGMIYNQSLGGTYSLVLVEHNGSRRRFSVLIGESEAQSIALHLNKTTPPRPLTHDLMHTMLKELHAKLSKVVIYKMHNDIFYSEIHMQQNDTPIVIDARTSDAIALAVRSNIPILIRSEILDIVGVVMGDDEEQQTEREDSNLQPEEINTENMKTLTVDELQLLLDKAVEEELYEKAALIRDEIDSRS